MNRESFIEDLEKSRSYMDLFVIVKKAVKKVLGRTRSGLLLYLGDLPLNVGAYHQVGSNGIVLNRRILEIVSRSIKTEIEMNSFVFSLLLHEYLHSLGYLDEVEVRRLVYNICIKIFGKDHPTAIMSLKMPLSKIYPIDMHGREATPYLELVKEFEKPEKTYIV
ncbi:MAG: hypothetical protein QXZ70_00320 [Candidatus Bathyarchaeia archaeon]